MSNTLDEIAQEFGLRPKNGMSEADWIRIAEYGDEKTLAKMLRYNRNDVRIGKGVLESLLKISSKPIESYMHGIPSEPKYKRK